MSTRFAGALIQIANYGIRYLKKQNKKKNAINNVNNNPVGKIAEKAVCRKDF